MVNIYEQYWVWWRIRERKKNENQSEKVAIRCVMPSLGKRKKASKNENETKKGGQHHTNQKYH